MSVLFLDDDAERCEQIIPHIPYVSIANTVEECIKILSEPDTFWNLVFLDHDLGGEIFVNSNRNDCGMEVVRWIIQNQPIIKDIIVHTHNELAGREMVRQLRKARYHAAYVPFNELINKIGDIVI